MVHPGRVDDTRRIFSRGGFVAKGQQTSTPRRETLQAIFAPKPMSSVHSALVAKGRKPDLVGRSRQWGHPCTNEISFEVERAFTAAGWLLKATPKCYTVGSAVNESRQFCTVQTAFTEAGSRLLGPEFVPTSVQTAFAFL